MNKLYATFLVRILFFISLGSIIHSCSLLKIESAQEPLSRTALNMRLVTQTFAHTASSRVEKMADSILVLTRDPETVKAAYLWKIKVLQTYANSAFQTSPELGLLDTWVITRQLNDFLGSEENRKLFKDQYGLVQETSALNLSDIRKKASAVLPEEVYREYEALIDVYAIENPLTDLNFVEQTLREDYYTYRGIPDSTAVETVGSLSEVVADMSNRFSYHTNAAGKNLRWNSQLYLTERGWDTLSLEQRMDNVNEQLDRLIATAEEAPDKFQVGLRELQGNLKVLFTNLDTTLVGSLVYFDRQREEIDSMLLRERTALDGIIAREREAIAEDVIELTDTFMEDVGKIVRSILIYAILLVIVVLAFPFAAGFYLGKVYKRKKALEERNSS